jgi:uncharacterized protein (TIGR00290 family)
LPVVSCSGHEPAPAARPRTLLAWSSGKDSAWALHLLRAAGEEVAGLLVTFAEPEGRVAMHRVRRELVEAQAQAIGLPLHAVTVPWPCPNDVYERRLGEALARARVEDGISRVAFGDLFLADIRRYREALIPRLGLVPVFPLWGLATADLARSMIAGGLRAIVVCADARRLDRSFIGREFDAAFLAVLPPGVDPCGENGEFHTFCYNAPPFASPIAACTGAVTESDGFWFLDVLPAAVPAKAVRFSEGDTECPS